MTTQNKIRIEMFPDVVSIETKGEEVTISVTKGNHVPGVLDALDMIHKIAFDIMANHGAEKMKCYCRSIKKTSAINLAEPEYLDVSKRIDFIQTTFDLLPSQFRSH